MTSSQVPASYAPPFEEEADVNLAEYLDILIDSRWLIAFISAIALTLGVAYALFARPVYESNLMVQVEDSEKSAGSFLGDAASSLFDVKTPAAGEIEIIRSRMILGQAVENTKLYISASPNYAPVFGQWLSRRAKELSDPGFLWMRGYVTGTEHIVVPRFDVPFALESTRFTVTAAENGKYILAHAKMDSPVEGVVGRLLQTNISGIGPISLQISEIDAKPGAEFRLVRNSRQLTLNALQDELKVVEKGKQSGVLDVSWQSADAEKLTLLLNEIGRLYVRQNIERKAAEAEKTLAFLNTQLPEFKRQLEKSEDVYNRFRNEKGTVSLDEEARNALAQSVDLQSKLLELEQRKRDLLSRFTEQHPNVQTVDSQIRALNAEVGKISSSIKRMPLLQQDTVRMQRDIKVNTDLYQTLLNNSLQMSLAKEGKVGNVRLLDDAVLPERAVKPNKPLIVVVAFALGLFLGALAAIAKSMLFGGIRNPNEIEIHTGLNVYSNIPISPAQIGIDKNIKAKIKGTNLLFALYPNDPAIESMRSLRTALQFAMLEAPNNRVLISGGTPGVGKSFVSANFASIVAAAGKKVLLIDADLRKGYLNQVFSLPRAKGLSEFIAGSKRLDEVLHREVLPNLDLISTGMLPPNPAELLMSESFASILNKLSSAYDLVIIDTAPVLVASDTASVAPHAGTILLVARAEKTHLGELNESVKRLAHVGCTANGVILNAMDMTRRHYGSYSYKYGGYKYTQYKYGDNGSS